MRVILRLLGNRGFYPKYPIETSNHLFFANEEVAFSVVRQPWDIEVPEVALLMPEEIRLYAALTLSEAFPFEKGRFRIHPWSPGITVNEPGGSKEFSTSAFVDLANSEMARQCEAGERDYLINSGRPFETGDLGSREVVCDLIDKIPMVDELIIRGLSRLLSANHLITFAGFLEEAAVIGHISLEAALEYIRQTLSRFAGKELSFSDVFDHIEETFPTGEAFAGVLRQDYEARILLIHASSRFGEFWSPPVMAGECYELMHSLIHLYRYIILGEIWEPAS